MLFLGGLMKEVSRKVLYQQGCFSRVAIWYEGHQKGINGIFTWGYQGEKQTMVVKDIIKPSIIYSKMAIREAA
jgi:hypothetical protein